MSVTAYVYNKGLYTLMTGGLNLVSDTLKMMLLPSTYTPDVDGHHFYSDISAGECPASGNYTSGGVTLSTKTVSEDDANDKAAFDCDDPSWAVLTQADIRYAVLYKATGVAGTSVLLVCWDFGATQSPAGVTFTLPVPAGGLFDISQA